jgi:outer membrane protein TolC
MNALLHHPRTRAALVLGALIAGSFGVAATPLTLNAALERLPNSLDWQSANLTYQAAQQSLNAARAAAGLTVGVGTDLTTGVTVIGTQSQQAGTSATSLSVSLNASLAILPWSSAYDNVRSATRALERAGFALRDTRNTLALNAVQAYQAARVAALDLTNAQAAEQIATQQVQIAQARAQNGQLSRDDLETARKNLENARLTTQQAQQTLEINRAQLFQTVALPDAGETLEPATARPVTTTPLETLVTAALTRRSDVIQAQSKVADAQDSLNVATRNRWLPNATLGANLGQGQSGSSIGTSLNVTQGNLTVSGSTPVTSASNAATSFTVSLSANINLFDPNADAKIRNAQLSLESAQKVLETTRQSAALDVRQKYSDASIQTRRVAFQQQVLQNAQAALETARTRFSLGSITALEVTQAQLTVAQAGRDLDNQIGTQALSTLRLDNALGTLEIVKGANP